MKKLYDVAIIGASGACGRSVLYALEKRNFPTGKLVLFSAENNAENPDDINGNLDFEGKKHSMLALNGENVIKNRADFVFFCAGAEVSKKFAPLFSALGCMVIDSSSAFKMEENVPLVLPSVNPESALISSGIIATPSSASAIVVAAVAPLYKKYGIKRLIYSTYQPVNSEDKHNNVLPLVGKLLPSGYTTGEQEMIDETRKIFGDNALSVTATAVNVPVNQGEAVTINIELAYSVSLSDIIRVLTDAGLIIMDYPTPLDVCGKNEVYIGRVRRDFSHQNSFNLWVVADNVFRGMALNMIEIAELLI